MIRLIILILGCVFLINKANAFTNKYYCKGKSNQFFIIFDTKNKTVITEKKGPNKYWNEGQYTFWQTAGGYSVFEFTFKKAFNNLSGKLKVKSHHLITSKDNWYNYECKISK